MLLYATGGLAYGAYALHDASTLFLPCAPRSRFLRQRYGIGGSVGWTAVVLEYVSRWTLKAEYLYLDLGNRSVTFADQGIPGSALTATSGFTAHIARGGINYRF